MEQLGIVERICAAHLASFAIQGEETQSAFLRLNPHYL
jgi:hypothetical protein